MTTEPNGQNKDGLNLRYQRAVTAACAELEEMAAPSITWPAHAAVIITKHLTPLFRELRDEAKRATQHKTTNED